MLVKYKFSVCHDGTWTLNPESCVQLVRSRNVTTLSYLLCVRDTPQFVIFIYGRIWTPNCFSFAPLPFKALSQQAVKGLPPRATISTCRGKDRAELGTTFHITSNKNTFTKHNDCHKHSDISGELYFWWTKESDSSFNHNFQQMSHFASLSVTILCMYHVAMNSLIHGRC